MKHLRLTAIILALSLLLGLLPTALAAGGAGWNDDCPENYQADEFGTYKPGKHNWVKQSETPGKTCTSAGTATYKCSYCGARITRETKAPGHKWGEWQTSKKATCSAKGEQTRKCKVCGKKDTRSTNRLPHTWGEWTVTAEATDFTMGTRTHACAVCGAEKSEDFYPDPTYKRGDKGDGVRVLQEKLNAAGYDCGKVDGDFGKKTEAAVKALEESHGFTADGIAWPGVQKWLEPAAPAFSNGASARNVLNLLRNKGNGESDDEKAEAGALEIVTQPVGGMIPWAEYVVHKTARGGIRRRDPNAEDLPLTVEVTGGEEPYTYQWYRAVMFRQSDGTPSGHTIGGDSPELMVSQEGKYYCEITDNTGEMVRSDVVQARFALHFASQPQSASLYGLESVTLTCLAEGGALDSGEEYGYQWFTADGAPVPDGWADGQTLTVSEPGEYYCVATDTADTSERSNTALVYSWEKLSLLPNQDCVTIDLGNYGYQEFFACTGGVSPYTFVLKKDGVEFLSETTEKNYLYYQVMDYGLYTCTVTDSKEASDSCDILVEYDQLDIREQPEGGVLFSGDRFSLKIEMDEGLGPFIYTLYRNGEPYKEWTEDAFRTVARVDESGIYRYHVEDSKGRWADSNPATVSDYQMSVKRCTQEAEIRNRRQGGPNEPAELTVEVEGGLPSYKYVWEVSKDGANYRHVETFVLNEKVSRLSAAVPGTYRCTISDVYAQTVYATDMQVSYTGSGPLIIRQPQDDLVEYVHLQETYDVTLFCQAITDDGEDQYLDYAWESYDPDTGRLASYDKGQNLEIQDVTEVRGFRCIVTDTRTGKRDASRIAMVGRKLSCHTPVTYESLSYMKGRLLYEIWGGTAPYTVQVMQHRIGVANHGEVDYYDVQERVFTVDAPSTDLEINFPNTYYDFIWYDGDVPTVQQTQVEYFLIVTDASGQKDTTDYMRGETYSH